MSAEHILDRVQSLAAIEALDPVAYAAALEAPVNWAEALARIDAFAIRVMRIRLEHAIDLPAPTRKVFAQTIVSYANDLPLLAERARQVAGEQGDRIVEAARATLVLRDAIRAPLLEKMRADKPEEPESPREPTLAELIELD